MGGMMVIPEPVEVRATLPIIIIIIIPLRGSQLGSTGVAIPRCLAVFHLHLSFIFPVMVPSSSNHHFFFLYLLPH